MQRVIVVEGKGTGGSPNIQEKVAAAVRTLDPNDKIVGSSTAVSQSSVGWLFAITLIVEKPSQGGN